jgi:threonine synthase
MQHETSKDLIRDLASRWILRCTLCAGAEPFAARVFGCSSCRSQGRNGLLECLRVGMEAAPRPSGQSRGLNRYRHLLPVAAEGALASLGEGGTALVRSTRVGPRLGLRNLYFKLEQQNPTLSFKDRYVALSINLAHHFGFRGTVVSSTGNLGVSVAAYSAKYGMRCRFVAPADLPRNVMGEAALLGAEVDRVKKEQRFARFEELAVEQGWFPVGLFLPRKIQNPFGIEAYRTFAYELIEDLDTAPDAVLFPCARGNGLYGAWKGFEDVRAWGWCKNTPKMIACQPIGANSLQISLQAGSSAVVELPPADSVARSICETTASDNALGAIRASQGAAVSASDEEIIAAVKELGHEGINAEASAAISVACLPRLISGGDISPEMSIVCIITGCGHRWPEQSDWVLQS